MNELLLSIGLSQEIYYLGGPEVGILHLICNGIIALAYFLISLTFLYILYRREDVPFKGLLFLFIIFIWLYSASYALDIWVFWHHDYLISGLTRLVTAIISFTTAIALILKIPEILLLPSPKQVNNINQELQRTIEKLEAQQIIVNKQKQRLQHLLENHQQAEIELDREKNFLQAILSNLSDGIVACDQNGILTLFNQATIDFHGLPHTPLTADQWSEHYNLYLIDGQTPMPKNQVPLFRALAGESVRDVEMKIVPKDGQPRTILANGDPIIALNGKRLGAVIAMRDVTELKKTQQALWESQAQFLEIFTHAAVGMAIVDLDGKWIEVNPTLCLMLGYSHRELQATNFQAITYSEDLDQDLLKVQELLSGEIASYQMEKRYIHKHGNLIWINLSVSLVRNKLQQPLYFVTLLENINQRKQAELALAQLNEDLEERVERRTTKLEKINNLLRQTSEQLKKSNQELEQFAYIASHDLKAPLRAIANLSQWLEEDLEDKLDDTSRHNLNLLRGRVHRLENLINGLLAYSRVGKVKNETKKVIIADLLADIIDLLAVGSNFEINIQGTMPTLITEELPLQQVFSNLISNAVKHSDRHAGKITISVVEQQEFWEFAVADNGQGIEAQYHDKIFTLFQTLKARDEQENTGIGLAIVKKAVENQGGQVTVESELGKGTTFRFTWKKISNNN
ncbi:multi-sensor signal transduction histidine kinase [Chondrocystis sp. NIES-4102]|nr:multi-sensor signal transduction histidine kinase [Chondrocystis sp. NIES-4102]